MTRVCLTVQKGMITFVLKCLKFSSYQEKSELTMKMHINFSKWDFCLRI